MTLATSTSSSPLSPGSKLDRYELLCPVAKGGMAEVWIARLHGKHGFQKLVAIKTILPEYATDPTFQKMFLDEAHISAGIEHVNVAQILDLGEHHDVLYIVMEFVDGESLSRLQRAVVKKGFTIPHGIALRILSDVCLGLHAAHELRDKSGNLLNVVHRDVSPQNILVSDKGVAKLIDFGIAKARDRVAGETSSGLLKGKIQYMPPEQAIGGKIDRRADVWAIGAILYHLLAGKPPYDADNQLATLRLLTSGRPPIPLASTVPKAIADVVRKALAFQAEHRWDTALQLHRALEAAMAETRLSTSTSDVAAFVAEHLAQRTAERKRSVDLALDAAAERERMNALLVPADEKSASGMLKVGPRTMAGLQPAPVPRDLAIPLPEYAEPATLALQPAHGVIEPAQSGVVASPAAVAGGVTEVSFRPKRKLALVAGGVGVGVIGLVAVIALASRGGDTHETTQQKASFATPEKEAVTEKPASASATIEPASASAAPSVGVAPEPTTSAAPSATTPPPSRTAPVVAAPKAVAPKATAAPKSTTTRPKPARIDDGF